jgi:hypothetical protein
METVSESSDRHLGFRPKRGLVKILRLEPIEIRQIINEPERGGWLTTTSKLEACFVPATLVFVTREIRLIHFGMRGTRNRQTSKHHLRAFLREIEGKSLLYIFFWEELNSWVHP